MYVLFVAIYNLNKNVFKVNFPLLLIMFGIITGNSITASQYTMEEM